jgi:inner membrane protein
LSIYDNQQDYVYINGTLAIDYPDEIKVPNLQNQHKYFILNNYTVTFNYCPLKIAIPLLKEQYGLGQISLIIKKISS